MSCKPLMIVLLSSASLFAGPVAAQTAEPATAANEEGIEDIVVTAQRREERLQTVPISITALTGDQLAQAGIRDITRLEALTPGLTVGQSGSDSRPAMRGVKTDNSRQARADASVAFFVDGIYQSSNQQALAGFVDVARVEVQRGPQGTLYGRNSFGGNISVITNLPTDGFEAAARGEYGSYDRYLLEGMVNVPLGEGLGLRVAGQRKQSNGYVRNLVAGGDRLQDDDDWYGRATLRWEPTDALDVVLRGSYWAQDGNGGGAYEYKVAGILVNRAMPFNADGSVNQDIFGVPLAINPRARAGDVRPGDNPFNAALLTVPAGVPIPPDPYTIDSNADFDRRLRDRAVNLTVSYDLDFAMLKSITAYSDFDATRRSDSDFTAFSIREDTQISTNETLTQELQLASSGGTALQWIVGLYYLDTDASEDFIQFRTPSQSLNSSIFNFYRTKSYAAYAQATYALTEQLRVTGGVRYTEDEKVAGGVDRLGAPGGAALPRVPSKFDKVTWRGAVDYQATPDNLLYASVSTGFRSGGSNTGVTAPRPLTFGPETVTAYEIGSKNRFLDDTLQLNVSAFYNRYEDLQVDGFDDNTFLVFSQNAGRAKAKGVELEALIRPVGALNVAVTAAYLDAYYTSFQVADPITGAPLPTLRDNRVAMSPKWRLGAALDYTIDLGGVGTLTPRVQTSLVSRYFLLDFNTPIERQGDYTKTDARLTYTTADERFSLEAFVTNLEDKAVKSGGEFGGRGAFFIGYAPPRQYGVAASVKF